MNSNTKHEWMEEMKASYSEHQLAQAEDIAKNVGEVCVYDQAEPLEQAAMLLRLLNSKGYTVSRIK